MPNKKHNAVLQAKKLGLTWSGSAWIDKNGKAIAKSVKTSNGDTKLVKLTKEPTKISPKPTKTDGGSDTNQGKGVQFEWAIVHQALALSGDKSIADREKNKNLTSYDDDVGKKAVELVSMLPKNLLKTAKHSDELGISGNPEPKTDIVFGVNNEIKASVKLDGAVQLSSAQGEATAKMLSEIAKDSVKGEKLKILSGIIEEVNNLPTKLVDPANLEKLKKRNPKLAKQFLDEKGKLLDKFNWQIYNEKIGRKLQDKIVKFLENDDDFLEKLIEEGLTGSRIFKDNPDAVANHIISPSGMFKIDKNYIKSIKKGIKIRIRAKSRGGVTAPVMSIDLNPKKTIKEAEENPNIISRDEVKTNLENNFESIVNQTTDNLDFEMSGSIENTKPENLANPENQEESQPEAHYSDLSITKISKKLRKKLDLPKKQTNKKIKLTQTNTILFDKTPSIKESTQRKTYVFTFGRFNPPTKGHEKLINLVISKATEFNADYGIFPSVTQDFKRNPLPHNKKIKYMKLAFPKANIIDDKKLINPFFVMKYLSENGYTDIIMIVGEDRVREFREIANKYVNNSKKEGLKLKSMKIISAGERDPDSNDDVQSISASKMREFAKNNDLANFIKNSPSKLNTKFKLEIFNLLKKNLTEDLILEDFTFDLLTYKEEYENSFL